MTFVAEVVTLVLCTSIAILQGDYSAQYLEDIHSATSSYRPTICPIVELSEDHGEAAVEVAARLQCLVSGSASDMPTVAEMDLLRVALLPFKPSACAAVSSPASGTSSPIILYALGSKTGNVAADEAAANALCSAHPQKTELGCSDTQVVLAYDSSNDLQVIPSKLGEGSDARVISGTNVTIATSWEAFIQGTLENSLLDSDVLPGGPDWWTGAQTGGTVSTETCSDWTSASNGENGRVGRSTSTGTGAIDALGEKCSQSNQVLCACAGGTPVEY